MCAEVRVLTHVRVLSGAAFSASEQRRCVLAVRTLNHSVSPVACLDGRCAHDRSMPLVNGRVKNPFPNYFWNYFRNVYFGVAECSEVCIMESVTRTQTAHLNGDETMETQAIGTVVISNDGFNTRTGQVADVVTDRWGTHHVVAIDGDFTTVGTIMDANGMGIGWKVATDSEVERHNRYRNADV